MNWLDKLHKVQNNIKDARSGITSKARDLEKLGLMPIVVEDLYYYASVLTDASEMISDAINNKLDVDEKETFAMSRAVFDAVFKLTKED